MDTILNLVLKGKGCIEKFIYKNKCIYQNNILNQKLLLGKNANIYKNKINSKIITKSLPLKEYKSKRIKR